MWITSLKTARAYGFLLISQVYVDKSGTILKISVPSCTNFCTRFSRRKSRRHKAYYIYKYILVQKYNNILYRVCPLAPLCVVRCAACAAGAGGNRHTLLEKNCIFVPRPEKPICHQEKTWYKNRYRGVKNLYQAVQKLYQTGIFGLKYGNSGGE